MKLVTEPRRVAELLGFIPHERLLVPNTALDARHVRTPVLLEHAPGRWFVLLEGIEVGSIGTAGLPPNVEPRYYAPYLWWDPPERSDAPDTLEELLAALVGGRELVADESTAVGLTRMVDGVSTPQANGLWGGRWSATLTPRENVLHAFERDREFALRLAAEQARRLPDADLLLESMSGVDPVVRFDRLDEALEGMGVERAVVTSGLNVQDVTGLATIHTGMAAIGVLTRQDATVTVLRPDPSGRPLADLAAELGLHDGPVAVEEDDFTLGQLAALALDRSALRFCSRQLRAWRDGLSSVDLPYFVLAAGITTLAIGATIEHVRANVASGTLTELHVLRELERQYDAATERLVGTSFLTRRSHINLHASSRSRRPGLPTAYTIPADETAVELDSGVFLFDRDHRLRASTDMCRCHIAGADGLALYAALARIVVEQGVPAARAGATGREIFFATTGALDSAADEIQRTGLAPAVTSFVEGYDRYVGHAVGKQRYVDGLFTRDSDRRLVPGQVGAMELPWGMGAYGISYEDMFVAHESRGLNITRIPVSA